MQLEPGNPRNLARAIRWMDDEPVRGRRLLKSVYHRTGHAWIIGVTGPAGVGKSTLVNRMVHAYRKRDQMVGVVAVDPTSPFSGGAILGDRIRMQDHENDAGVFIRSLATRGQMGGLSRSAYDIVDLMDAYGMDIILVETVGVGQDEVDIARLAGSVVLVLVPGLGDEVQALKAGLMEIADLYVINKKSREGAQRMKQEIEAMLGLLNVEREYQPAILLAEAAKGEGIVEILDALDHHKRTMEATGAARTTRMEYARMRLFQAVRAIMMERLEDARAADSTQELIEALANAELDPYSAAVAYLSGRFPPSHDRGKEPEQHLGVDSG